MRRLSLGALAVVVLSSVLSAQTPKESLLALSKRDHTLAIVDPSTLKVLAKAPVGNDPHEVIASADGKTAYVSNYGGGAHNTLAVIDLVSRKALPPIDLGPLRGPHGLVFVGGKVWFTAEAAKAIGSYDPAAQKIDWILGTGQNRTHMIYVFDDLKRIVTTNVSSGTVSLIERTPPRTGGGHARTCWRRLGRDCHQGRQRLGRIRCLPRRQGDLGRQRPGRNRVNHRRAQQEGDRYACS